MFDNYFFVEKTLWNLFFLEKGHQFFFISASPTPRSVMVIPFNFITQDGCQGHVLLISLHISPMRLQKKKKKQ